MYAFMLAPSEHGRQCRTMLAHGASGASGSGGTGGASGTSGTSGASGSGGTGGRMVRRVVPRAARCQRSSPPEYSLRVRRLPDFAYRLIGRFSVTRLDRILHPLLYRWSGGRGLLGRVLGCETILVTTRGRRSGHPRTVALFGFPIDRGWAVIASRGGSGEIPAWYRNIEADRGDVTVQVRAQSVEVVARDTDGEEYERLFAMAARTYPGYRVYRARAPYRIPVVALERAATDATLDADPASLGAA